MKRLILAATALGALALAATPAAAQRHRGHTSVTIGIGSGYSPFYGGYYGPSYGYSPYAYGYEPYADFGYYTYPSRVGYDRYYDRSNYSARRHRRHHRHDRDYDRDYRSWDRYGR